MIKNFNHGDIIVVTSERDALAMCIATGLGTAIFDHDLSFDEAAELTLKNIKYAFPKMYKDWTLERVKETLDKDAKYFITTDGDVKTYANHELADSFDKLYFEGKIKLDKLHLLKDKYVKEHNVKSFKFPGDKWPEFRIYDDVTDWVNEHINDFE